MERLESPMRPAEALGYVGITLAIVTLFALPGVLTPIYWRVWATLFVVFILLGTIRYYLSILYSFRRPVEPHPGRPLSVDIVVPVLDEARVLPRHVRSILAQDHPGPIRAIYIVDADCRDASLRILRRFAARDPRIVIGERGGAPGKVPALNRARGLADADVVGFVDADVSLAPDLVRRAVAHLTSGADAVKGRSTPVNKRQGLMTAVIGAERDIRERIEYYSKHAIGGFTVLTGGHFFIRREVLDRLGWFDEGIITEDMDLAARIQIEGYHLVHDPLMMAYEEAPGTLRDWYAQRYRWYRGWLQGSRRNLGPALMSRHLRGFHLMDTAFLLASTLIAPLLVLYYVLVVLKFMGISPGAMVPNEVHLIASSISLFTPLAILLMAYHERRVGRRFPWVELPAIVLILPYLLLYSVALWQAFLDEFVLRRPNRYRKYRRSGRVDHDAFD